jgi:hypothetical protein
MTVLVGAAAAFMAMLSYREQRRAQDPVIELAILPREETNWFYVTVRNKGPATLRVQALRITRPRGTLIGPAPPGANELRADLRVEPVGSVFRPVFIARDPPGQPRPDGSCVHYFLVVHPANV